MLLIDLFEKEYRPSRLVGKSPETSRLYRLSIQSFSRTVGHPARVEDLTNYNLAGHMTRVIDAGRSPGTANKDRAQIMAIWNFAARRGIVDRWPDVQAATEVEQIPLAWTPDEVCQLIAAASKQEGKIAGVKAADWWVAIIYVCLDTAERIGAVRQLRWSNIVNGWVIFPGATRKGRRRDNAMRLQEDTLFALNRIREPRRPQVFPWPYSAKYIWSKYAKVLESAGLPSERSDKFHRLRKTTATFYDAQGLNATRLLDHSDPSVTRRYIDPRQSTIVQACDVLAEILRNPHRQPPENDGRKSA